MPRYWSLLNPNLDWDSLPQEEQDRLLYAAFPDEAYKRIQFLSNHTAELSASLKRTEDLVTGLLNFIGGPQGVELRRRAQAERRRVANLHTSEASEKNAERSRIFEAALSRYITKRLSEQPFLTTKQIISEVERMPWNKKNKEGDPYGAEYLRRKISPLVTAARATLRRK